MRMLLGRAWAEALHRDQRELLELRRQIGFLAARCDALRVMEVHSHGPSDGMAQQAVAEERQYRLRHGIDV